MGLSHTQALIVCIVAFFVLFVPFFLVLYWDILFPKINKRALIQHLEDQKEQRAIQKAIERDIQHAKEAEKRRLERERLEREWEEQRRQREQRRLEEMQRMEEQKRKEAEYREYINAVFCDPFYKTGQRRVKTTDAKVFPLWQQAVERLDNGASIHSVVVNLYRKSASGPTYTAYHNSIKKLYSRHRAYIEAKS